MDNYNVMPENVAPKSAATEFKDMLISIFASPLFLTLAIVLSVNPAFSLISMLTNGFNIFSLLLLSLPVLTAVGCWLLWANARKGVISAGTFTLATCYPTYMKILFYIIGSIIALIFLILIGASEMLGELFEEIPHDLIGDEVAKVLDMPIPDGMMGALSGILFFILLIIEAVFVIMIIRYTYLTRLIRSLKQTATDGKIRPIKKPMFFIVVSFIQTGFAAIGFLMTMNLGDILSILSNLASIASTALVPVILLMSKNMWNALYDKQQRDAVAAEQPTEQTTTATQSDYQTLG